MSRSQAGRSGALTGVLVFLLVPALALMIPLAITHFGVEAMPWILGIGIPVIVVVSFLPFVPALRMLSGRPPRAFKDAAVGIATIQSVTRTGTTVNDNPVMRFEVVVEGEDGVRFDSVLEQLVPLHEMHVAEPGLTLPVRYLPRNHSRVIVDETFTPRAQHIFEQSMLRRGLTSERALDVAHRGLPAKAVVRSLAPTGRLHDAENPEVRLALTVTPVSGEPYEAEVVKVVQPRLLARLQPGAVVDVRYLPDLPHEVALAMSQV